MKVDVIFKKWNDSGEIIAIFPHNKEKNGFVESYEHNGQHSLCGIELIKVLETATENEYKDLKQELEEIGYELNVLK